MFENSEFEVLTLSLDLESLNQAMPDSESTPKLSPIPGETVVNGLEEDAVATTKNGPAKKDFPNGDMSSDRRGAFAVRSKVSPLMSVFVDSGRVWIP